MIIILPINDFLKNLFPELNIEDNEQIVKVLNKHYTYLNFTPEIEIKHSFVHITIDIDQVSEQNKSFYKVQSLCDKGRYDEAKPTLNKLIEENHTNSEYYRVKGQIYSDEGNQEEAINYLIDALKWNPSNVWALIMMGNIYSKYKSDIDTAMIYNNQALDVYPNNYVSLYNIGVNLIQQGEPEKGRSFIQKTIEVNKEYPNSYNALAVLDANKGNYLSAFNNAIKTVKYINPNTVDNKNNNC